MREVKRKRRGEFRVQMSPTQCKAARAALQWSQDRLAEEATVSRAMVTDFETGVRDPHAANRNAVQATLEAAGVEFIEAGRGRRGVTFKDEG